MALLPCFPGKRELDGLTHSCLQRYLDVTCLVFGADHTYLGPIDYDHRISTEAVGAQGAVHHSGDPACLAHMQFAHHWLPETACGYLLC